MVDRWSENEFVVLVEFLVFVIEYLGDLRVWEVNDDNIFGFCLVLNFFDNEWCNGMLYLLIIFWFLSLVKLLVWFVRVLEILL